MRLYDRYLATLALLFTGTTLLLALLSQHQLELYFTLYFMEYLGVTFVFAYLQPRARRFINFVTYLLFAGFVVVVTRRAIEVILPLLARR